MMNCNPAPFQTPADFDQCYKDFVRVFRHRWRPEQGETLFDRARTAAFEKEVCRLGSQAGWLRLYLVYADEAHVAGYLGYVCNNKFYAGLPAHSPALHKHGPGTALISMTVEHCIANHWTELDMTRGDEPYQFQWNGVLKRNYRIRLGDGRVLLAYVSAVAGLRAGRRRQVSSDTTGGDAENSRPRTAR